MGEVLCLSETMSGGGGRKQRLKRVALLDLFPRENDDQNINYCAGKFLIDTANRFSGEEKTDGNGN